MTLVTALLILLGLTALDWLLGIFRAMLAGTFSLAALPKQLENVVLPYVGSYVAVLIPQSFQAGGTFSSTALTTAAYAIATTASAKLVGDIVVKALGLGGQSAAPAAPQAPPTA